MSWKEMHYKLKSILYDLKKISESIWPATSDIIALSSWWWQPWQMLTPSIKYEHTVKYTFFLPLTMRRSIAACLCLFSGIRSCHLCPFVWQRERKKNMWVWLTKSSFHSKSLACRGRRLHKNEASYNSNSSGSKDMSSSHGWQKNWKSVKT